MFSKLAAHTSGSRVFSKITLVSGWKEKVT